MFRQKAVAVALMLILTFNILAFFVGELSQSQNEAAEDTPFSLEKDTFNPLEDVRKTRAEESLNIDLLSRSLYGPAYDVMVSGDYAYLSAGFNLLIFDITDKANPELEGYTWTYTFANAIDIEGSYAYIVDVSYGLLIIDISNPAMPQRIGGYQVEEGFFAYDVKVSGSYAYLARFDPLDISNPDNGFLAIDISSKSNPQLVGEYNGYLITGLDAIGNTVYATSPMDGLRIVDMSIPSTPLDLGHNDTVFAWNVNVFGNTAYVVDSVNYLWLVNITDTSNPEVLAEYPTDGPWSVHVDLANNIAYVAGHIGLTLLDVSDPSSPVELDSIDTGNWAYGVVQEGTFAYVACMTEGIVIVDAADPMDITIEGSYFTGDGSSDVVVSDSTAYIVGNSAELMMYDMTDPTNPITIGATTDGIYAEGIEVGGSYAYVVDGDQFLVYDIGNPANPTQSGSTWLSGYYEDMCLEYPYVYVATGEDGISIVDVSNPSAPSEVNVYSQVTESYGVHVSNGYLFIADGDNGLRIANLANPENPGSPVTSPTGDTAMDVFVKGNYAYVAMNESGLRIVEVTNPMSPQPRSTMDTSGNSMGVYVTGGHAFVADGAMGLEVVDVTDAQNPNSAGYYNTSGLAEEVIVHQGIAYVSSLGGGLYILDVSQLSFPEIESVFPKPGTTDIPLETNMIINFTKGMDKSTVQSAFSYTDGSQTWTASDGTAVWTNQDKSMTFTPFSQLNFDSNYQVTIDEAASDKDGKTLASDYTWSFSTLPEPPQVTSHHPQDGALNIAIDEQITINFSKTMDRLTVLNAFSYTDGTNTYGSSDGTISWSNSDTTFTFNPNAILDNAVEYTINLSYTAEDTIGFQLDGDGDGTGGEGPEDSYTWSFSTIPVPPTVNSTSPVHGSTLVPTDTSIVITFSKSMNREDTIAALEYTDGSSTVSPSGSQVVWTNNNRTLTFNPATSLANEKTFTFTVYSTAKDMEGAYLDADGDGIGGEEGQDDFSFSFATMHLPAKVMQTTPAKKAAMVEVSTDIVIRFSRSMDNNSVETAFSYTHENTTTDWGASDGDVHWSPDSKIMTFTPDELLDHDRVYTVTILGSAKDTLGVTLDGDKDKLPEGVGIDDYAWEFTTIKEPPRVISLEPENNSLDVSLDLEMNIRFDRSMDTRSVEQAFSFTHSTTSETWEIADGTAVWTEGDSVLTFTPDFRMDEGMLYTVTIEDTAEDEDGIRFPGLVWHFTTKVNSPPLLENGGVNPDPGAADDQFTFSIVYTDADDDEATEKTLVIDQVEWRMYSGDPTDKTYTDGKAYEFIIELDEGQHEYYFEFSDGKNTVRFPEGSATKKLQVKAAQEDGGGTGFLDEEYAGVPGMICFSFGLIIIIVIVLVVVMITRRGRRGRKMEEAPMSFQSLEPETSFQMFDDSGGPPGTFTLPGDGPVMSFAPFEEESALSFTTFDETPPSLAAAQPAVVQCPDCGEYLRVRAAHRPFEFPCKCGARLVLK